MRGTGTKIWSPDGKYLLFFNDVRMGAVWANIVDFSGSKPVLVDVFKACDIRRPIFISNTEFLWTCGAKLMKKRIGEPSIEVVNFSNTLVKGSKGVDKFQFGSNNNILYKFDYKAQSIIFLTNLKTPQKHFFLSCALKAGNPKERYRGFPFYSKPKFQFVKQLLRNDFDLSPDGSFVVLYYEQSKNKKKDMAVLIDLNSLKIITKFLVRDGSKIRWSPDSGKVLFLGWTIDQYEKNNIPVGDGYNFLNVVNLIDNDEKNFGGGYSKQFNWTSDGGHIFWKYGYDDISILSIQDGRPIHQLSSKIVKPIGQILQNEYGITLYGSGTITPSGKLIYWKAMDVSTFFIINNPFYPLEK